ncbi:MAG TPA: hypothetical protein VJ938_04915 [Acidimicrobiia bacterium]|nr:hypothetical protein [Acidimicrobiia bacterium]
MRIRVLQMLVDEGLVLRRQGVLGTPALRRQVVPQMIGSGNAQGSGRDRAEGQGLLDESLGNLEWAQGNLQ